MDGFAKPVERGHFLFWLAERLPAAPATQDIEPDSLAWRPLSADNPHVHRLARYLPLAEVLAFPAWAAGQVAAHLRFGPPHRRRRRPLK